MSGMAFGVFVTSGLYNFVVILAQKGRLLVVFFWQKYVVQIGQNLAIVCPKDTWTHAWLTHWSKGKNA